MSAIKVKNLHVEFFDSHLLNTVLEDISFTTHSGEFVCLVGPSGCGKTTILNAVAGLIEYQGEIEIVSRSDDQALNIGYVFQTPRLLNWLTIRDNVFLPLSFKNLNRDSTEPTLQNLLYMVGISNIQDKHPLECSEGEKARAGIARALSINPSILLMDEPFSHLDELTARKLRQDLLGIWAQDKKTVIFVTHNTLEAVFLADRIYVLSDKPTRMVSQIQVKLSRPRSFEDKRLFDYQREVLNNLGVV